MLKILLLGSKGGGCSKLQAVEAQRPTDGNCACGKRAVELRFGV